MAIECDDNGMDLPDGCVYNPPNVPAETGITQTNPVVGHFQGPTFNLCGMDEEGAYVTPR